MSLLPSATEIVCELGLGADLVGVTHECDHPPFVRALPKVTRTLGIEVVGREGQPSRTTPWQEFVAARPDALVIACCGFDAERTRQDLPRRGAPRWILKRAVMPNVRRWFVR